MANIIDRTEIDAMRDELVQGGTDRLAAPFLRHGLRPPVCIWNPAPDSLPTSQIPFVLRYWQSLRDDEGRVAPDKIDSFLATGRQIYSLLAGMKLAIGQTA